MADLSQYASFSVTFDKSADNPRITVVDTSNYPTGVEANLSAVISILQPDGIEVTGNFTTPDMVATSGQLPIGHKTLRLASNGELQKGEYVITLFIRDSTNTYTETTVVKTFKLYYTSPVLSMKALLDVFTPELTVKDTTTYFVPGFTFDSVLRDWAATIKNVGDINGSDTLEFDMKYSGSYYDSEHSVIFSSRPAFTLSTNPTVLVYDDLELTGIYKTHVPTSLNDLFVKIIQYKKTLNEGCCNDKDKNHSKSEFAYIMSCFEFYKQRGVCGADLDLLVKDLKELELLLSCYKKHGHTYLPIPAYSFNDFCGWGGGASMSSSFTAPIVSAEANQMVTLPVSEVTLIGDVTGNGNTYLWTKDSGPGGSSFATPTAATTLVTGLVEGTYVFRLTATNSQGQSAYDTITITVNPAVEGSVGGEDDIEEYDI